MAPDTYQSRANHRMLELQGVRLASFRSRAIAFGLDFVFVVTIVTILVGIATGGARHAGLISAEKRISLEFNLSNWYSLVSLVCYFGLLNYRWEGRTFGKHIMRIQVVSTIGPKLTFWQSISRALGYATSALQLGFGFLLYFFADNRLTTHDRIAGTIVVKSPLILPAKSTSER